MGWRLECLSSLAVSCFRAEGVGCSSVAGTTSWPSEPARVLMTGRSPLTVINDILGFSEIEAGKFELNSELFDLDSRIEIEFCFETPP